MLTVISVGKIIHQSSISRHFIPSVYFCGTRLLHTRPDLSHLQALPFPPTKPYVSSVLEKWRDEPVTSEACGQLFHLIQNKPGCGSLWSQLISVGIRLDRRFFAESIADFILSDPNKHNSAAIMSALSILVERGRFTDFYPLYIALRSRLSETDLQILAPSLIGLLSQSPMWNEAMDLIPLCDASVVSIQTRRVINGAVRYGSLDEVFSLLKSLVQSDLSPSAEFFNNFFHRFLSSGEAVNPHNTVNSLLQILSTTHWSIPVESAVILCEWFSKK